jgi:hypothetical protein
MREAQQTARGKTRTLRTGKKKFNRKGAEVEAGRKNPCLMYPLCALFAFVVNFLSRCVIAHIGIFSPGSVPVDFCVWCRKKSPIAGLRVPLVRQTFALNAVCRVKNRLKPRDSPARGVVLDTEPRKG